MRNQSIEKKLNLLSGQFKFLIRVQHYHHSDTQHNIVIRSPITLQFLD